MFQWFRILIRLSKEENILENLDRKHADFVQKMEELTQTIQADFNSTRRLLQRKNNLNRPFRLTLSNLLISRRKLLRH